MSDTSPLRIECTVWCARCKTDKFRVVREPTGMEGVVKHARQWAGLPLDDTKTCNDCGEQLSRKEDHG